MGLELKVTKRQGLFLSIILASIIFFSFQFSNAVKKTSWQNGDIVFQDSESRQSRAIKLATNSKFSHCGIVFQNEKNGQWMVLEAIQPVQIVPIEQWIDRGTDDQYSVKRLKSSETLNEEKLSKMYQVGKSFVGKNYDIQFGWGDDKLYCSELVWKIYKRGAGIEVGSLKPLKDYNLNDPIVRKTLEKRYGSKIPLNDKMISPQDVFESNLLE